MGVIRSLHNIRITFSPAGLVFSALILYLCPLRELSALAAAAAVHELGHIVCLVLAGADVRELRLSGGGLSILYGADLSHFAELICALSGPALGFAYAFGVSHIAVAHSSELLALSAGASLALSLFNLLPVLPLDGGRAVLSALTLALDAGRADSAVRILSAAMLILCAVSGLYFALHGYGPALLMADLWLVIACINELGIVKSRKMI